LQGSQCQHSKANLAKEPALFPRFRDTPYSVGHNLSTQITKTKGEHTTKVFAKAGLDKETSAMCYYQQQFRLDIHYSALVLNFNHIFSIGHLHRAGQSMNSLPSQILKRYKQPGQTTLLIQTDCINETT